MKRLITILLVAFLSQGIIAQETETYWEEIAANSDTDKKYVLVIHGGSGTLSKENMTPELEADYRAALTKALKEGYEVLKEGKSSLDGVVAAIKVLENSPLFNAGRGAVFNSEGVNEMDASIMNGENLKAGAVSSISTIKNPIEAARAVLEQSEHVMLSGKGAEEFAAQAGAEVVAPDYFKTEERWKQLQVAKQKENTKTGYKETVPNLKTIYGTEKLDFRIGTVGSVALDKNGNLAAGTSTGGMTNKKNGRIGDSPIIGAGTYCNNLTAGISCTGWGEFFIRNIAAGRVSMLMEYTDKTLDEAGQQVIAEIAEMGGDGGLIALDRMGNVSTPFSTQGMYRGMVDTNGEISVFIYK